MATLITLQSLLLPLLLFTLLATGTPGPNNILLTLSGSQFGFKKTIPFILGIRFGILLLFCLMGVGIGTIIVNNPNLHFALKLLGACYLTYLAFKIAFSTSHNNTHQQVALISFKKGILMQFINPKAMTMVLSCIAAFSLPGEHYIASIIQAALVFTLVGVFSNILWALFGVAINSLLSTTKAQLIFNRTLAVLTLLAIVLLF